MPDESEKPITIPTSPSNSEENKVPETAPQSIHDGAPPLDPVTGGIATGEDAVVDQGRQAKELKLTAADCPYSAQGDNRAKWFEGFGEDDPEKPAE